jgi:hypothetical protein
MSSSGRSDFQRARAVLAVVQRIERVVGDHRLDVAVGLDRGERLARGGDAGERHAQRIVEALGGGIEAPGQFPQHQLFIVDDKNA